MAFEIEEKAIQGLLKLAEETLKTLINDPESEKKDSLIFMMQILNLCIEVQGEKLYTELYNARVLHIEEGVGGYGIDADKFLDWLTEKSNKKPVHG